jgi:hypothetical protein
VQHLTCLEYLDLYLESTALKLPSSVVGVLVTMAIAIPGLTACGAPEQPNGLSPTSSASGTAAPAPTVSPEDLNPSTYEALSPRDFALLVKDPDANKGRKIILYGVVTQFDTDTGQSSFRANTGAEPSDTQQNTIFYAHDQSILTKVVAQDAVKIWCQVDGTETYKTTQNGELTVPKLWVNIIRDNGSTNPDQN